MSKKVIKYFAFFVESQQKWLNEMAKEGCRLVKTGKLTYEFEKCAPGEYEYCLDFVAEKSLSELNNYKAFLKETGYNVFSKNVNLNWSFGKVRFRPYGKGLGKISTTPGTFNKEILIVEKKCDGKPFILHTTGEDKLRYYKTQRNAALWFVVFAVFMLVFGQYNNWMPAAKIIIFFLAVLGIVPLVTLQRKIIRINRDLNIHE